MPAPGKDRCDDAYDVREYLHHAYKKTLRDFRQFAPKLKQPTSTFDSLQEQQESSRHPVKTTDRTKFSTESFVQMKLFSVAIALTLLQFARAAAYYPKDVNGNLLVDGDTYCVHSHSENAAEHGIGFINTQDGSWLRIGSKAEQFTFNGVKFGSEQRFTLAKDKVFKMSGDKTRLPCSKSFMETDKGGNLEQFVAREEHPSGAGYYYKMMVTGHCSFGSCADYDVIGIKESGTNIKYLYAIDETCGHYTSPKFSFYPKAECEKLSK
ncbi:hypothetical protein BGX28_008179 [Mortierella sp. GBA30]|nr:hypothetical protein BGX28_008179 [Mortierella sp. GBA30]